MSHFTSVVVGYRGRVCQLVSLSGIWMTVTCLLPVQCACHWRIDCMSKKACRYSHSPTGFLHSSMHCYSLQYVSPLSACLTEANWRHPIAEGNRLEQSRRATNILVCCVRKYVIILVGGDIPIDVPPNQNIGGDVSPASPAALTPVPNCHI